MVYTNQVGWAFAWLNLIDDSPCGFGHIAELPRGHSVVPVTVVRDGELVIVPRLVTTAEDELADEVIQGGAKVVHDLPEDHGPLLRNNPVHVDSLDVFGRVLIRIDTESVIIEPGSEAAIVGLDTLDLRLESPQPDIDRFNIQLLGHDISSEK
jgi:hypothetical protein